MASRCRRPTDDAISNSRRCASSRRSPNDAARPLACRSWPLPRAATPSAEVAAAATSPTFSPPAFPSSRDPLVAVAQAGRRWRWRAPRWAVRSCRSRSRSPATRRARRLSSSTCARAWRATSWSSASRSPSSGGRWARWPASWCRIPTAATRRSSCRSASSPPREALLNVPWSSRASTRTAARRGRRGSRASPPSTALGGLAVALVLAWLLGVPILSPVMLEPHLRSLYRGGPCLSIGGVSVGFWEGAATRRLCSVDGARGDVLGAAPGRVRADRRAQGGGVRHRRRVRAGALVAWKLASLVVSSSSAAEAAAATRPNSAALHQHRCWLPLTQLNYPV